MKDKNKLWKELDKALEEVLEEGYVDETDILGLMGAIDDLKEAYGYGE